MEYDELMRAAQSVYAERFPLTTNFERAIFFSWYCAVRDCQFCYMSTQPKKPVAEAKEARRSIPPMLAEALIAKVMRWEIGFISGGIGAFTFEELLDFIKKLNSISAQKHWLNIGPIPARHLERLAPHIKGVVGSVETLNPSLHDQVCPSKPLRPYLSMFDDATRLGISKAICIIVGLGESIQDVGITSDIIARYGISKAHVYGLNPVPGTALGHLPPPTKEYQAEWIARLRLAHPGLDIQCGIWQDKVEYVETLLRAGANSISKYPILRRFSDPATVMIKRHADAAGRRFTGIVDAVPDVDWDGLVDELPFDPQTKVAMRLAVRNYVRGMLTVRPSRAVP
ncbi:MAG: radical SAM protein [Nanoarchaeota archaeon]